MSRIYEAAVPGAFMIPDNLTGTQGQLISSFPSTAGGPNVLSEGINAAQPSLQLNSVNGKKMLLFDGTADKLVDTTTTTLNNVDGATFYCVFVTDVIPAASINVFCFSTDNTTQLANQVQIYAIATTGEFRVGGRRVQTDAFVSTTATGKNVCDGVPHIGTMVARYSEGQFDVYVDGTYYSTGNFTTSGRTSAAGRHRMTIGTIGASNNNFWDGLIGACLMYETAHDAANRAKVHSWAQDYYGIPVSDYVAADAAVEVAGPVADVKSYLWEDQAGAKTYLTNAIDEATASDTDFVISPTSPVNSVYEVKLPRLKQPASGFNLNVSYRLGTQNSTTNTITVELMENQTSRVTWNHSNLVGIQTFTQAVTPAQWATITDFADLRLKITANAS